MSLIVQKYGGSSVASPARLRSVVRRIAQGREKGDSVVVVVSAMGEGTDQLSRLARDIAPTTSRTQRREMDQLLATGELVSSALLAMALVEAGVPALSLTGEQAGIETDGCHGAARIQEIRSGRVSRALAAGSVPVIAGFQGVGPFGDVSTLGRGGSDTTAVALSVALDAARCDIYTDVPGIFTADPRVVPAAWRHRHLGHADAVLMSRAGAVVLHPRAAVLAAAHRLPVSILSSRSSTTRSGTLIQGESPVERPRILGVAASDAVVRLTARLPEQRRVTAAELVAALSTSGVEVQSVRQESDGSGACTIALVLVAADADEAMETLGRLAGSEAMVERTLPTVRLQLVGSGVTASGSIVGETIRLLEDIDIPAASVEVTETGLALDICPTSVTRGMRALHERWLEAPLRADRLATKPPCTRRATTIALGGRGT